MKKIVQESVLAIGLVLAFVHIFLPHIDIQLATIGLIFLLNVKTDVKN